MLDYTKGIAPELVKKYRAMSDEDLLAQSQASEKGPEQTAILAEMHRRSHEEWMKKPFEERSRFSKEKFVLHKEDIII